MALTIINGSPKGEKSHTRLTQESFIEGFMDVNKEVCKVAYLVGIQNKMPLFELYRRSEMVIFIFSLDWYAMPVLVRDFLEDIESIDAVDKKLGFIVHSGFPASMHCQLLELHLHRYTSLLQAKYLGTVFVGSSKALSYTTEQLDKKFIQIFYRLGRRLAKYRVFDKSIVQGFQLLNRLSLLHMNFLEQTALLRKNKSADVVKDNVHLSKDVEINMDHDGS